MSTTAVTPGAPAASESNSEFLPVGEKYRLTGALPSDQDASAASGEQKPPAKEGESATPNEAETAAASAAAQAAEERKPAARKTPQTSESRWAKLSRENRELQEQLRQVREGQTRTSTETQRETQQESRTATEEKSKGRPEPKIDDVDPKTGRAKYATLSDYLSDVRKWDREQSLKEFEQRSAKTQQEQQQAQTEQIIEREVNQRVTAARKAYPDYDQVAAEALAVKDELGRDALFYVKGSHLDGFFLDSDRGHDVLYHIFKNFDDCKHIFARDQNGNYLLNPVRQLRELAKIENSLPEKGRRQTSSVPRITQAPPPPHQVSGKGTVAKDAVEDAVETGDFETFQREQNARVLASRKKGK